MSHTLAALRYVGIALAVFAYVVRKWTKKHGRRPQMKSPYRSCWYCQRRLSTWTRYVRVDGYCSNSHRRLDAQKFTVLAQERLEESFRRSLDALTIRMEPK